MEKKSDNSSLVSSGTEDERTGSVDTEQAACSAGSHGTEERSVSRLADQAEDLIGLASEAILKFEMAAEESKPRMQTSAPVTKDVAVSLGNIFQFVIASDESAETFVSVVVEAKDFMQLLFNLMQKCIVTLLTSDTLNVEILKLMQCSHSCLVLWTNVSKLFAAKLQEDAMFGDLIHVLTSELRVINALWTPEEELTRLGDLVLRIIRNFSKDEKCHKHLVGSKCIRALLPLCFSHRLQTKLEAKCIVATLYLLLGPSYNYFLKLSNNEREFYLACLPVAASDETHLVEVATGETSRIKYSASELATGLGYLLHDEANRAYFAQKTEIFLSISLLLAETSSEDDQVAAVNLLYKLVAEPRTHNLIRDNYPDVIYRLMSLHESGSALLKEKTHVILTELDLEGRDESEIRCKPKFGNDAETEIEFQYLLRRTEDNVKKSGVFHGGADPESFELTLSLVHLVSFFSENWHVQDQQLCLRLVSIVINRRDYLPLLRDFIFKHFHVCMTKEIPAHQFHPLSLVLHSLLLWSKCSTELRRVLGETGILLQLVGCLRTLQAVPAWDQHQFRIAELLLFIVANCALELTTHEYLLNCKGIETVLPFTKSYHFQIRLGAKRILSSLATYIETCHRKFLQLSDDAELRALAAFATVPCKRTSMTFTSDGRTHYFFLLDLILVMSNLADSETNRRLILCQEIQPMVSFLLTNGTSLEKEALIELVYKLCAEHVFIIQLLTNSPEIVALLPSEALRYIGCKYKVQVPTLEQELVATAQGTREEGAHSEDLIEMEDIIYETMHVTWSSRLPLPPGSVMKYAIKTAEIRGLFVYLIKFFASASESLCKIAVERIANNPSFLRLIFDVIKQQTLVKAEKGCSEQDIECLKLIFHCLQKWAEYSEEMKVELANNGLISRLITVLFLLQALPSWDLEFLKLGEASLSTIAQCLTQPSCQNYTLCFWPECESALTSMASSEDPSIGFNAKVILSHLACYLPANCTESFAMSSDEVQMVVESLDLIVNPRAEEFHDHTFSALELLRIIIALIQNDINQDSFAQSDVFSVITTALACGTWTEQEAACELLWKLSTKALKKEALQWLKTDKSEDSDQDVFREISAIDPESYLANSSLCAFIEESYPELKLKLCDLKETPQLEVIATCTLLALRGSPTPGENKPVLGKDVRHTLIYIEGCCRYGKYVECVNLANHYVYSEDDSTKVAARLYKGKALYYLYSHEQKFPHVPPKQCLRMAKEVIGLLSDMVSDSEVKKLRDIALLDYIRKKNDKYLVRCLLCQSRRKKLKSSHIWPAAVLKHFVEYTLTPEARKDKSREILRVSWRKQKHLHSSGVITFYMLCGDCEQMLSSSCENKFKSNFFSKIYEIGNPQRVSEEQFIDYGKYLYQFFLSVVFRAIPILARGISIYGNSNEIYKLFDTCQSFLLGRHPLSVDKLPQVALLITPTNLPQGTPCPPFLDRILHSAGSAYISTGSLEDGFENLKGKGRFLVATLGVLAVVVSLEPSYPLAIPPDCIIKPGGGSYHIPSNLRRFHSWPLGLWREMSDLSRRYAAEMFKVSTSAARLEWMKEEVEGLSLAFKTTPLDDVSHTVINFLPEGFSISKPLGIGGKLQLPEGHLVLLHIHRSSQTSEYTLFLAAAPNSTQTMKLYAILVFGLRSYIVTIGYLISQDEPIVAGNLNNEESSLYLLPSVEATCNLKELTNRLLPVLLKRRGFYSLQSLLFRMKVSKGYLDLPTFDTRCSLECPCWYCVGKCDNCMKPASFEKSPLLHYHVPNPVRFCSNECCKYYQYSADISPIQIQLSTQEPVFDGHRKLFTVNCSMLDPNLSRSKVTFDVYLGDGSREFPKDQPYILFHKRTIPEQLFLEFFISDDLLPKMPFLFADSSLTLVEFQSINTSDLSAVLATVLAQCGYSDLHSLVERALQGKLQTTKPFSVFECSPLPKRTFNFLPKGFSISEANRSVCLPSGHNILFHESYGSTIVFVAAETDTCLQAYAILHMNMPEYILDVAYTLSSDKLAPYSPLTEGCIDDQPFSAEPINIGLEITRKAVKRMLKKRGILQDLGSLMSLRKQFSQCESSDECWFCQHRCSKCTRVATTGCHTTQLQFCLFHWLDEQAKGI